MTNWLAANLAQRAARDEMNEAKRREAVQEICPICGVPGCYSPFCWTARRKAEQQAQMAVLAARHLGVGL